MRHAIWNLRQLFNKKLCSFESGANVQINYSKLCYWNEVTSILIVSTTLILFIRNAWNLYEARVFPTFTCCSLFAFLSFQATFKENHKALHLKLKFSHHINNQSLFHSQNQDRVKIEPFLRRFHVLSNVWKFLSLNF